MLKTFFEKGRIEAGCDEAGRGCLAGPVFAAAVILPPKYRHRDLNDSKQLDEASRYRLRKLIEKNAIAYAVGVASVEEIEKINILHAAILAMHRALDQLCVRPESLLIDGNFFKKYQELPHHCIIEGDGKYMNIAAASVLAKTYRDDHMKALHNEYPAYNWSSNKGYGTQVHREAISSSGITPHHRRTFHLEDRQLAFW